MAFCDSKQRPTDVSAAKLLDRVGLKDFGYFSVAADGALEQSLSRWPLIRAVASRLAAERKTWQLAVSYRAPSLDEEPRREAAAGESLEERPRKPLGR